MFTKRHYKAIADIIKECGAGQGMLSAISPVYLASLLADYFEKDNPLFNRVKWFNYLNNRV